MSKEKFLVLLTEGELEKEILQVIKEQGYKMNGRPEYCGNYTYKFTKDERTQLKLV